MSNEPWRSDVRYQALDRCSAVDLAWEFLRRNPDYRADYNAFAGGAPAGPARVDDARWGRWGLSFRGGPGPFGRPAADLLAT